MPETFRAAEASDGKEYPFSSGASLGNVNDSNYVSTTEIMTVNVCVWCGTPTGLSLHERTLHATNPSWCGTSTNLSLNDGTLEPESEPEP